MTDFLKTYAEIFESGGVLMLPLAALALYLYYGEFSACLALHKIRRDFSRSRRLPEPRVLDAIGGRIKTAKILSSAAPLLGLLGTICGICSAFSAYDGAGAGNLAGGISAALITTQAGLVVAIPSWLLAVYASAKLSDLRNLADSEKDAEGGL